MLFVFMSKPDFSCNPYALWEYIKKNTDYDTAWIVREDRHYEELLKRNIRCAIYNTLDGQKLLEEANFVIMNTYVFTQIPKKTSQIFVNLWHGSGIKAHDHFNHDMSEKNVRDLKKHFDKIDLMCVHGLNDRFKLSAMLHFDLRKVYVTGQPRLDCIKESNGYDNLIKIFGERIAKYDHFIFYTPTFRSERREHSGQIYSENVFRLTDFDNDKFNKFLIKYNAALIYKLHPNEEIAFEGREFNLGNNCYKLTDDILFNANVRYTEILNSFDVMIGDYSSIVFDYLLLNRPIVYLIPDYDCYKTQKGFECVNINTYTPGDKAFNFEQLIQYLEDAMINPNKYKKEREFVLAERFDYKDNLSSKRCLETILNYKPIDACYQEFQENDKTRMPSVKEQTEKYLANFTYIIDSTKSYIFEEKKEFLTTDKPLAYITSEIPDKYRRLTGISSTEILDLDLYYELRKKNNCIVYKVEGGVDYSKFSSCVNINRNSKKIIGFAGTIDCRIYFSMVQCICEVFSDCEIVFVGHIYGEEPVWLNGFENLHYIEATYDELPEKIQSFDIAILPFFQRHNKTVPSEIFQYLAAGKQVVTSDMPNIPYVAGVYKSKSISEFVDNVRIALNKTEDKIIKSNLQKKAEEFDWEKVVQKMMKEDKKTKEN